MKAGYSSSNKHSGTKENHEEQGVILLTVIIFLVAILALALPLVLMSMDSEKTSARVLDNAASRMYSKMALDHVKCKLRKGIYENEYEYVYGIPTSSPTATPSDRVDLQPFDTPIYDGPAEMFIDRMELNILADDAPPANGDIATLGVQIEDEQSKLNVNSLTPDMLLGLFFQTQNLDPAEMADTEIADIISFVDTVMANIALKRVESGTYRPISNIDDLLNIHNENGSDYLALNETQFEAMKKFLTVYSWRLHADGFSDRSSIRRVITEENLPADVSIEVESPLLYKVFILDEDDNILRTSYMYPERQIQEDLSDDVEQDSEETETSTAWVLTLEDVPQDAVYITYCYEEFHPVNINTCSQDVLVALLMSKLDFHDDIAWSLENARELAKSIIPKLSAVAIDSSNNYKITLDSDCDYQSLPEVVTLYSIAGLYIRATRSGNVLTPIDEDQGAYLAEFSFPTSCRRIFASLSTPRGIATQYSDNTDLRTTATALFKPTTVENNTIRYFCTVGYDIYTITSSCRVTTSANMTASSWQITEVVELGKGEDILSSPPEYLDTYYDFSRIDTDDNYNYPSAVRKMRVSSNGTNCKALPVINSYPPHTAGISENSPTDHVLSFTYTDNLSIPSNNSTLEYSNGTVTKSITQGDTGLFVRCYLYPENITSSNLCPNGISQADSRIEIRYTSSETALPKYKFLSQQADNYMSAGNYGISLWVRAHDWNPGSDSGRKDLFTMIPAKFPDGDEAEEGSDDSNKGGTFFYIRDGHLYLYVEDDIGSWGMLDYTLSNSTFPADTWMHVSAHVGGNKQGQMAMFLDGRPLDAEYTSSTDRGYCHQYLKPTLPRVKQTLVFEASKSDTTFTVASTTGFPDAGYLRIEDEIVYYASKTDTAFTGIERGIGTTEAEDHSLGKEVISAFFFANTEIEDELPKKDDEVQIVWFPNGAGIGVSSGGDPTFDSYYIRNATTQAFTLDIDAVKDESRNRLIVPFPADIVFSETTAITSAYNSIYLMMGLTGTCTTGAPTSPDDNTLKSAVETYFLSSDGDNTGFPGYVQDIVFHRSNYVCKRLAEELDASTNSIAASVLPFTFSEGRSFIVMLDDEVIGMLRDGSDFKLTRGMLGTTADTHSLGAWGIPLSQYSCSSLPSGITANANRLKLDSAIVNMRKVVRVGDEVIFFKYLGSREEDGEDGTSSRKYYYDLIRGFFGSSKSSHSEDEIMVPLPTFSYAAYDFSDDPAVTDDYIEFVLHDSGMRYHGLTWEMADEDTRIETTVWFSTQDGGNFYPIADSQNMFVFTDNDSDSEHEISRGDGFVLSDDATIRIAFKYLSGAWEPNSFGRHSWKSIPMLDRIMIWRESADVVYYHTEGI